MSGEKFSLIEDVGKKHNKHGKATPKKHHCKLREMSAVREGIRDTFIRVAVSLFADSTSRELAMGTALAS